MAVSTTTKRTLSQLVLRIALALFLVTTGILTLQLDRGFLGRLQAGFGGNEIATAVHSIFKGDVASLMIMLLGVLVLVAGVFLLIGLFINVGNFNRIALFFVLAVWVVVIILVDIIGKGGLLSGALESTAKILSFLKVFSAHLLVLGAILNAME